MRNAHRGFTLIELMVVISVAAILAAVGVPSFKHFIANQRVKSTSIELTGALFLARSEAVKRNANVTLAPKTTGDWTSGWTIMDGTAVLFQQDPMESVTIAATLSGGATNIVYQPNGRPTTSPNMFQITGTTSLRCIRVDASGVPNTQTVACS